LMPQFKGANPAFCNAYFAARVVVSQGKRASKADTAASVTPVIKKAA